jgi:hypothetical protein
MPTLTATPPTAQPHHAPLKQRQQAPWSGLRRVLLLTLGTSLLATAVTLSCAGPGLEAPAGEAVLMTVFAHGVQIHECRSAPGADPAWVLVATEAALFDAEDQRIGHHGAGPVWQHHDGSGFVGTVRARVESPQPRAIPWLLLSARPQGSQGVFGRVSSVQRLNTVGGQPPSFGCNSGTLGRRVRMAYRADYVLYTRTAPAPRATPSSSSAR